MNGPIREKFSFLNFLNEDLSNLDKYGIEKDENLDDGQLIKCIKELFQVANENAWLVPKQELSSAIKKEFERIFKDNFTEND